MCGIMGYLGPSNAVDIILEGLKRMEYRGYDSAGISICNEKGELEIIKKAGNIEVLREVLEKTTLKSHVGIGHTRWATHGEVTDRNAHPHENQDLAIIHNGIIENAYDLRDELKKSGARFSSDTDSEVFLVLVNQYYQEDKNLLNSVRQAFKRIKGNSAFVVMAKGHDELVAIKRAAPLVCGQPDNQKDAFISSDPYALVGYTDKVYFPEDEILCMATKKTKE